MDLHSYVDALKNVVADAAQQICYSLCPVLYESFAMCSEDVLAHNICLRNFSIV